MADFFSIERNEADTQGGRSSAGTFMPNDSDVEDVFEGVVELVRAVFDVPIAEVRMADRPGSRLNDLALLNLVRESCLEAVNCIDQDHLFVIEDLSGAEEAISRIGKELGDEVGFFAAAPILIDSEFVIGGLYVADTRPRVFTQQDCDILRLISDLIVDTRLVDIASDLAHTRRYAAQIKSLTEALEQTREAIMITKGGPVEMPGPPIVWMNDALLRLTGYCRDELVGESPERLHASTGDGGLQAIERALELELSIHTETENERKDGSTYQARWNISPVYDESDNLTHWVIVLQDVTKQREREARLEYEATHDPLTDLLNRAAMKDAIVEILDACPAKDDLCALFYLDLNRFKMVNDTLGHAVGDDLLVEVAEVLQQEVGDDGIIARLGGDEFAVCMSEFTDRSEATSLAERLCKAIQRPIKIGKQEIYVQASIGLVVDFDDYTSAETLLADADIAMYAAKRSVQDDWVVHAPEMRQQAEKHIRLRSELPPAIRDDQFVPYFQPIVSLEDGALRGFEVLARWDHPDRGIVTPKGFLDVAERHGLIIPIGHQVIEKAFRTLDDITSRSRSDLSIALSGNFSREEFFRPETRVLVQRIVDTFGIEPANFVMEITERTIADLAEDGTDEVGQLRNMGVSIVIDDFGTGYSSLRSVMQIPVDGLKIDRSLTSDVTESKAGFELVRSVTNLCDTLEKTTTAEGIETVEQLKLVRQLGCTYGQGYLIAHPTPADEVERLINEAPWKTYWSS